MTRGSAALRSFRAHGRPVAGPLSDGLAVGRPATSGVAHHPRDIGPREMGQIDSGDGCRGLGERRGRGFQSRCPTKVACPG